MQRTIASSKQGYPTQDGAGVSLWRVLGADSTSEFDPILMLDSFDATDSSLWEAGFPFHPHRGIETISYLRHGQMVHKDSLGNVDAITDGEVQWMCAGSGILHAEELPKGERMLGLQLWLNLPQKDKMCTPSYRAIHAAEIPTVELADEATIRVLAGRYTGPDETIIQGYQSEHLPFNYLEIVLKPGASITLSLKKNSSAMLFSLLGPTWVKGERLAPKTAAKLTEGDELQLSNEGLEESIVMLMESEALHEDIAWAGPIVMNTQEELREAFAELENGTFIKSDIKGL